MRGLKSIYFYDNRIPFVVASFMDAWIEIIIDCVASSIALVASFMDAWIEIHDLCLSQAPESVASFMDAWIEIRDVIGSRVIINCRILYGCVD